VQTPPKIIFNSTQNGLMFTIPGTPIAKARATPFTMGKKIGMYDGQSKLKKRVALQFKAQLLEAFSGAKSEIAKKALYFASNEFYFVRLWFYYPIPVSDSMGLRNAKLWGLEPCIHKPDLDNMEKFYLDCANQVLWPDDCMITQLASKKSFDKFPRTEMHVIPCKKISLHPHAEKIITIFDPDRLQELLNDAEKLKEINLQLLEQLDDTARGHWFMATASVLAQFFKKYSLEAKKISKYLDYEYNPFDSDIISL
jgi:hypothetical protein